ncbi:MAG: methylenetetrahydrofolate--tRNA-(uracil(54)-C(5))-methyltransferase (FADH(2)-oxidizing) TrmFO [Christensenellales bacterium]|jgi:methylenetetrahydrofolate--tRNA-(uracil-5-)-methyltransferase
MQTVKIIGGGLAGAEAAYQLAKRGKNVELYEMRPHVSTPVHKTGSLAELVCSNSLKSEEITTAAGLLKEEMRLLDSLVIKAAEECRVPSGSALAVDRALFSATVERLLSQWENIKIIREEADKIEDYTIVACGPLPSEKLTDAIKELTKEDKLYFYDAVAPIVAIDSVDMRYAFWGSRYNKGGADYLNCPMDKEQYTAFVSALRTAQRVQLKQFENSELFSACMPVEVLAEKGEDTLRFGPLRPVGITSADGTRGYAVVQLRREDNYLNLCNLVGFQTNLTFGEQERVFRMIPALAGAEFVRHGVMHRNTFINSPLLLDNGLRLRQNKNIYFAGQITGVEGYIESAASGLIAGINFARQLDNKDMFLPPDTTLTGSLLKFISSPQKDFQPMHASFSLLRELGYNTNKNERKKLLAQRAISELKDAIRSDSYA